MAQGSSYPSLPSPARFARSLPAYTSFTPTCHSQVPGYVELYEKFKGKGVEDIYIVAVNDMFVMNAWKKQLCGDKDTVKFGE